ncbi:hypothetical protein SAMN05216505_10266 [Streptomyces prasinopilosus]|uniref:Uncharacterized protein n=1 Tax=Streptomyces prasinopilosus TaxID=67344 RepID=A0A1G6LD19_9ACTN|nr:hypothetical protein SAMN05216505_10266 [Streptomyces prasinopilosus]
MSVPREVPGPRGVTAGGPAGAPLRAQGPLLGDLRGSESLESLEGCHGIPDPARPALVRPVPSEHLGAGVSEHLGAGIHRVGTRTFGVRLSEGSRPHPGQSTGALVIHRPQAGHFTAGDRP